MKVSEAEKLVCPIISVPETAVKCITTSCMFWESTISGKKEIDRKKEPYDMTPMDISYWIRQMKHDGYVNIGREDGFRDVYVKYKEANEGYCQRLK